VRFTDQPMRGAATYTTLGLSKEPGEDIPIVTVDWRRSPFISWVATSEPCPECGQTTGHFHLADGRLAGPSSGNERDAKDGPLK
jgi:hypothetical protein